MRCQFRLLVHITLLLQLHAEPHRHSYSGLVHMDGGAQSAQGRSWSAVGREEAIIIAEDSRASDEFGTAVASNGEVVVVGAPNALIEGTNVPSGAVYVFRRSSDGTWQREGKMFLQSSVNKDFFGRAVDIHRNVLAVGAHLAFGDVQSVGLVYTYTFDEALGEWKAAKILGMKGVMDPGQEQKPGWGSSVMPAFYYFGKSLSVDNGTVLVGAYGNDAKGAFSGSVFFYSYDMMATPNGTAVDRSSWRQVQRLIPDDLQSFSLFGWSVCLSGDYAVVGAYGDTINARPYAGSAYVFVRGQDPNAPWAQMAKLTLTDSMAHDHFGSAVAIMGDKLAISSQRLSADKNVADGIVYLYRFGIERTRNNRNNGGRWAWLLFKELHVYAEDSDHLFGYSLSMYDNLVLVGFSADESFGKSASSTTAYLFSFVESSDGSVDAVRDVSLSPFTSQQLVPGSQVGRFGCSVSIQGKIIVVGASLSDGANVETGVVYSYTSGIDYFPVGDSTYDFLVYFLPGAFIAILMGSIAVVIIGNIMNSRQRRYLMVDGVPAIDGSKEMDESFNSAASTISSTRGLVSS